MNTNETSFLRPLLPLFALLVACGTPGENPPGTTPDAQVSAPPAAQQSPPDAVQQPLVGGPYPALLLTQAWFYKDAQGKPKPGPARLEIWRQTEQGWQATRLEDADSNVFHKAVPYDGGIITIGAEQAMLKKWTFEDGHWTDTLLWSKSWGGKFNRLRDLEIGDVDGDGKDEFVIATHDYGVIAVYNPDEPDTPVIELDQKADTFVHEIEIGDIDGDGKNEFFATPSARNTADASQQGGVVMYRWDGSTYQRSVVVQDEHTHAKEILVSDLDGDGTDELLVVMEAQVENKVIVKPVEIQLFRPSADGFTHSVIATIDDRQNRFLTPGDLDGDGQVELVAAAMSTGVWVLHRDGAVDAPWRATNIDADSGGFEHASNVADLDGDGKLELYVAADKQRELKRYVYDAATGQYSRTLLGKLEADTFTWNVVPAKL